MATLTVGIDIGTSSVKAVALKRAGHGFALKAVGQADIRRAEFHPDETPQALAEAVLRALERVSRDGSFSRKPCAFSVCGPRVAPRLFKFPYIPPKEVDAAIRFEAENIIPFDLSQAALDFVVFGESEEDGKAMLEGLVVAVQKEEIDKRYVQLKSAGFEPVVLDIDTLALANAYVNTEDVGDNETVALLNIGARFTNLTIMHGPDRAYVRDIATAGDMVSRAISEIYGLDLAQAEKRKKDAAFTPLDDLGGDDYDGGQTEGFGETTSFDGDTQARAEHIDDYSATSISDEEEYVLLDNDDEEGFGDTFGGDQDTSEFAASSDTQSAMRAATRMTAHRTVLADALGDLVSEVQDTFKYYINRRIVPRVDRVQICGGTAKFPEVAEFFASQLGLPCELWNPFARVDVSPVAGRYPPNFLDEYGPAMAVATGLAMREA
jgi:type IV pilus assembly protein PilM